MTGYDAMLGFSESAALLATIFPTEKKSWPMFLAQNINGQPPAPRLGHAENSCWETNQLSNPSKFCSTCMRRSDQDLPSLRCFSM